MVRVISGDITRTRVDVIVNAANEWMLGGGGVDGAIHEAAGPGLLEACRAVPELTADVRCPTGEARITPAFDLPAKWVVHAVGPRYRAHPNPARALASAHRASLVLAEAHGAKSIAFPAISCGAYGYPAAAAARVAATVVRERAWALQEIVFVLFTPELLGVWKAAFGADTLSEAE